MPNSMASRFRLYSWLTASGYHLTDSRLAPIKKFGIAGSWHFYSIA
jgi:hypothetical protein